MRMSKSLIVLTTAALLGGCGSSAHAATRGYTLTNFKKIRVEGPFDVHVHVGTPSSAKATALPAALDRLSVEVYDDTLVIRPLPGGWGGWPGGDKGKVLIDVGTRGLTSVGLAGSGDVQVDRVRGDTLALALSGSGELSVGALDVTKLNASMTGSGDLSVAGRALQAKATLTGSGDFHGDGLAVGAADVTLAGSGNVSIGAKGTAKVMLAGSGDVSIIGSATCTVTRAGSGDVHCAHQSVAGQD